jgi:lipopolysaccharide/colanic/teichoic acid biosynthesis glycosyltransferase
MTIFDRAGIMEIREPDSKDLWDISLKKHGRSVFYKFSKRIFDLVFSVLFIIVCTPIILIAAVLMQLESPGPVFYLQKRIGLNGKVFRLVKLRSMPPNAEENGPVLSHEDGDGRVGRIGRFMRKSKVDELPQFLNVLMGHMSIVGPRPERPYFVEVFKKQYPEFDKRHLVKPGVTGLAQFKKIDAFQVFNKLKLDLFYIEHRSFGFDMKIVLHTGAYCLASLFDALTTFKTPLNGVHPVSDTQLLPRELLQQEEAKTS